MPLSCSLLISLFQCFIFVTMGDKPFDHFVFSREWPPSICIDAQTTGKHQCVIPEGVSNFIVHGLWPTEGGKIGPSFCNDKAKFDPSKLSGILDQLNVGWPNLYADSQANDFWKHEWMKHGTCAMSLPSLSTELDYFQQALNLHSQFDLLSLLSAAGITPSADQTYAFDELVRPLQQTFNNPVLTCVYNEETKTQSLSQIEICLSKEFEVITCPHSSSRYSHSLFSGTSDEHDEDIEKRRLVSDVGSCRSNEPISLPPFNNQ